MSMRMWGFAMSALALSACAVGPDYQRPESAPTEWHSTLPHGGKLEDLNRWWEQLNDPLLTALIKDSEKTSPNLDMALAKMNEARANVSASTGIYYPSLSVGASSTRSRMAFGRQVILQTNNKVGFDASWELDLFGKNRRTAEAARARYDANDAAWHDARISLAAEVADVYVELRQCEASLTLAEQARQSRSSVRELTNIKESAGLASAMDTARAQAGEADGDSTYAAKQGECARVQHRLVALTGIEQNELQQRLSSQYGHIPVPSDVDVSSVAARALSQRPDVAMAEMNVAAASADIGASKAALYPSLTLMGSVANNQISQGGQTANVPTWSFGPALTIPLFSGGRASAFVDAAQARYDFALASYHKTVREAVRNVEDNLVRLNVANERSRNAHIGQQSYQYLYAATETRYNAGLANRAALEDARRASLQAQDNAAAFERETVSAWIALYKALGGGWQSEGEQEQAAAKQTGSAS